MVISLVVGFMMVVVFLLCVCNKASIADAVQEEAIIKMMNEER